jgi:hypothetical protein
MLAYSTIEHRPNDANVPRAEPLPAKALVIEDTKGRLPAEFTLLDRLGVKVGIAFSDTLQSSKTQ